MELTDYPRVSLGAWPTPLQRAERLEAYLRREQGSSTIAPFFVKRDDLTGFALAGNKTRQLEYLLGEAVVDGFTALVVGGLPSSNFVQGAAVAARVYGLACHVVLPGHAPALPSVNVAMALACGAELVFSGGARETLDDDIRQHAATLSASGRKAMAIPRGGSTPRASLGFARAAAELRDQLDAAGHHRARVVIGIGSAGSIAGLASGIVKNGLNYDVVGVSVSRNPETLEPHLARLVAECLKLIDGHEPDLSFLRIVQAPGGLHGRDYLAGPREREASAIALRTEGLILDPEYTARAFPFAVRLLEEGDSPVVFWHTGGLPAAISEYARADDASAGVDDYAGRAR
jgi:1-aminocyclopropane-1-carboxylate deaminase/D-cysteine desulfhydrase-like pyridoxal-dependent ACC family enzyme